MPSIGPVFQLQKNPSKDPSKDPSPHPKGPLQTRHPHGILYL